MAEPSFNPVVNSPPSAAKMGPRSGWGPFWWAVSISMHGILVACIVYFTPVRQWFFARPNPEDALKSMQGMRLGSVVANLFDVHVKRIKEKVKEQEELLAKMMTLRDKGWKRYQGDLKFYNSTKGPAAKANELSDKVDASLGVLGASTNISLDGKSVQELYATAQTIEKATYEAYRQIRAVELARLQNLPLMEASENTSVAVPPHEAMDCSVCDPALLAGIANPKDERLEQLRQQLTRVRCEIEGMVAAGYRMLDYVKGLIPDDVGSTVTAYNVGPSGAQEEGRTGQDSRSRADAALGYTGLEPGGFTHDWGLGVGPVTHKYRTFGKEKSLTLGNKLPIAARKVMEDAVEAEWIFVDTWHIIGPFANPNRKGIDQKYPPEVQGGNGVDLDAVYLGKPKDDGKPRHLRWLFRQSQEVCVGPHFPEDEAVYYAYSEVYSEKDQDLWCLFGSDDWGRCWINGEVVYTSGKTPHPWIPDRGIKQVRFRKGANSVLFKFENAWGRTGFSLCINLKEP